MTENTIITPSLPVTKETVSRFGETLRAYAKNKASLEKRIVDCDARWRLKSAASDRKNLKYRPASAWLFNSIINKHADVMDSLPSCEILPREESDSDFASVLSSVLPAALENCDFESVYSDVWFDKLKYGTGVYGVFWDPSLENGLGDVTVRRTDLLSIYWEPGINDIQDSKYVFVVDRVDSESLVAEYPFLEGKTGGVSERPPLRTGEGDVVLSGKTDVVDVYYKVRSGGKKLLHYCKFACGELLFASENEPEYEYRGFYSHGLYPFVFDRLFPENSSPCGFGYIDVMKDSQEQIDLVGESVAENVRMASRVRYFARGDGSVNEEEFADWDVPIIHYNGSGDPNESVIPVNPPTLPTVCLAFMNNKIEELKETSGNTAFHQGSTALGVTAASAIAALQESSSKLSRDMIKGSYRAFTAVCRLVIEDMLEFYKAPRYFRLTGPNGSVFAPFPSSELFGGRRPVYDVKVAAQKKNAFSRLSQNELAKEFYAAGFFDPARYAEARLCLEMMDFEGKEILLDKLRKNAESLYAPSAPAPGGAGNTKRNVIAEATDYASSSAGPR